MIFSIVAYEVVNFQSDCWYYFNSHWGTHIANSVSLLPTADIFFKLSQHYSEHVSSLFFLFHPLHLTMQHMSSQNDNDVPFIRYKIRVLFG